MPDLPAAMVEDIRAVGMALIARLRERKTYDQYRARLWGAMVRLFNGGRGANFDASFNRSIDQQLTAAWNEGAADMGVSPDEMTQDDISVLEAIINNEIDFIQGIGAEIAADRDAGMTREDFDSKYNARADIWANRYNETVNRARMQFGSKARLIWTLGATEKHCPTCEALDGIIAYGYEWDEARFQPQAPPNEQLSCNGWNCDCSLLPTEQRRTPPRP